MRDTVQPADLSFFWTLAGSGSLSAAARELGLTPVMWNATAHDWDATNAEALASRVRRLIHGNQQLGLASNVLLHDGGHRTFGTDRSVTLQATASLLESWKDSDVRLVTIDRWR